jgi:hypothetical protein
LSTAIRCKKVVFSHTFRQGYFGHEVMDVLRYEGQWRVCYRPNGGGVTSVTYRTGDATWTCCFWEWHGNDSGYPSHLREAHTVYIYYRGSAQLCFVNQGCGNIKHPWITFTFTDATLYGTLSKNVGVV